MHEAPNGERLNTYREMGEALLGEAGVVGWGARWVVGATRRRQAAVSGARSAGLGSFGCGHRS